MKAFEKCNAETDFAVLSDSRATCYCYFVIQKSRSFSEIIVTVKEKKNRFKNEIRDKNGEEREGKKNRE